jgi:hypothetical protein
MRTFLRALVSLAIMATLAYGILIWMAGTTKINGTSNGENIPCKVYIDGKYVGETPFEKRLGPGSFSIKVEPPPGYEPASYNHRFWTVGRGDDIFAEFDAMKYVARLNAQDSSVDIWLEVSKEGKVVGTCGSGDGNGSCDVDLPGPGEYSVTMTAMCEEGDEPCEVKKSHFTIKPENSGMMNIDW